MGSACGPRPAPGTTPSRFPPRVRPHPLRRWLARWTLPPAALAAIAVFSAHEVEPQAAAEGAYLGRLAAAVLVAVAALAPPPAAELGLGAVLAAAAVWALPAGPGRGAAVLALLAATLAVATARRLRHMPPAEGCGHAPLRGQSTGGHGPAPCRGGFDGARLAAAVALCFGWQALLRGELLFAPGRAARPWAALVVLPVAAGAALALLWRRHGALPSLAAAGAAAVLAPGWTVATTLALVALAGGDSLAAPGGGWRAPGWRGGARLAAGGAALLLPVAWEPRAGWAAALAGLALRRPGLAMGLALPAALLTRGAALPGALGAHASWREGTLAVAWLVMLVPAALLTAKRPRHRAVLAAAALLAFATPWLPDRSALAAPLALAALALPATGAAAGLAAVWSAALLGGTALLASYPWLRQDPLGEALALLGVGPGPVLAAAIGGAALLLGAVAGLALRLRPAASPARIAASAAGAALFTALILPQLAWPDTALLTAGDTVRIDRANPSWHTDIGSRRSRGLILQTSLFNAASLSPGTPVARVRLFGSGSTAVELLVRAGQDTGEWAARRPGLAATERLRAPRPWLAWVAGDFFGQRYRVRLPLPRPGSFARLQIDLAGGLPPDTGIALHQVELEP
jgi:hypothetical protein